MKSPDDVKKGLECCKQSFAFQECGSRCPYYREKCCGVKLYGDASALIQRLETNNHQLLTKVEQLQAELNKLREKETPKPCEHKATLYKCLTCPSCGNVVSKHEMWGETEVRILPGYCQFCGQRIELPKEG